MLKFSVKLLIIFLIFLCFFEIVELRNLRDSNEIAKDSCGYSIKKLKIVNKVNKILNKVISRKIKILMEIEEEKKIIMKSLENYQKILRSKPPIENKIYINILSNKNVSPPEHHKYDENINKLKISNDGKMHIDDVLKISNKEIKDMPIATKEILNCPFDQVYMKGKGCISNSKIYKTTMQNQYEEHVHKPDEKIKLSESENLKLDKLFSTEKNKNFKSSNHEKFKIIDDLITGHEKFSKNFHIFLNNPKYEILQEKLNQKSKSIEDSSKNINHFERNNNDANETFSDISLKSPFDLVIEPKSKHESLKLIDFPNTSKNIFMKSEIPEKKNFDVWIQKQFEQKFPSSFKIKEFTKSEDVKNKLMESPLETKSYSVKEIPRVGQNLDLFQGIDGKNLVFEFIQPYKLSENEKKLVHDKSSKIYFNPSNTVKDEEHNHNYHFKNWFSNLKLSEKNSVNYDSNHQGDIKFRTPETINFDHKYTIDVDPRTKLTATDISIGSSKMILNPNNFIGYKDLSGSKSNKYTIQWIGSSDQKNIKFSPIKPSDTSMDTYSLSELNRKNQEEKTPSLKIKWIPSAKEKTLNNYDAISLQKENEKLKKLLSKINLNRDIKFGMQKEGFDNFIDSKHQIISNSASKFSQPVQKTIVKSSMLGKNEQNPLFFQSKFSKTKKENDNSINTNNANYLDILMKIIALAKDGNGKKTSNFTYSTLESANPSSTFISKPMISTLPNEDEPIVDEGELSDDSLLINKLNPPVNSFQKNIAISKFTLKNGLNSTKVDSLPTKNVNTNNLKEKSSQINENIKMNKEENKNFDQASKEVKEASMNIANDSNTKSSSVIGITTLSNQTSEQSNLHKNLLNPVEKISSESSSKILNDIPNLFDFDHSTIGFPKQKSEDVNTILTASPASYNFKSVNIPKMKDEAESILQKSSDVEGLSSIAGDLFF